MKRKILSIALVLGMMLSLLSITPVSASDTTVAGGLPYFFNDFEDGINILDKSNVSVVDGGIGGSGKALKIQEGNSDTCSDYKLLTKSGSQLSGTIPAGTTLKISFWVKLSTPLQHCYFLLINSGRAAVTYVGDGASTDWQKIELMIQATSDVAFSNAAIRTGANGTKCNPVVGATVQAPGERSYLIDDFEIEIIPNTDDPGTGAPLSANLQMTGEFAPGNTVAFTQNFTSGDGVATDASIVKLLNTTSDGKTGTLAYATIGGDMTVPELPEGGTLSFCVVPIDSDGTVGTPVSYTYIEVVGFVVSLELFDFAADGSVTAKVNMENMKHDHSDVNAVLIVLMYDADGALVKYEEKSIVCPYNTTISGETEAGKLRVTSDAVDPEQSEVASAEAYLWDCGAETTPSHTNTTMKELAPDVSVTKE